MTRFLKVRPLHASLLALHADLRVMPTSQGNSLSVAAIGPVESA